MLGTINSKDFEQLVFRIIKILEDEGSAITWNASIPDPDSPDNPRQIDILIEKNDKKTHVECRFRKKPQSSNWVEELYGRKTSLKVDSIIGVSVSGFYKPAIVKARSLGVIIRDFKSITDDEIRSWGNFARVKGHYIQLIKPKFEVFIPKKSKPITNTEKETKKYMFELEKQNILSGFFSNFAKIAYQEAQKYDLGNGAVSPIRVHQLHFPEIMNVLNRDLSVIRMSSQFRVLVAKMDVAYAGLYGEPKGLSNSHEAMIQNFPAKDWELIKTNNEVNLQLDISSINHPDNCILEKFEFINFKDSKMSKYRIVALGFDTYKPMASLELDIDFIRKEVTIPKDIEACTNYFPTIDFGK
jgi:predicted metal-binding protein